MTTLKTGRDIDQLIKLVHHIIAVTPGISQVNFFTELESTLFDRDDWKVLKLILGELEFTAADPQYLEVRNFLRDLSPTQARAVRMITKAFFKISDAGRRASLGLVRDSLVALRNDLTDLIQNHLSPFIASPPTGISPEIYAVLKEALRRSRSDREGIRQEITAADNSLAALS